MRKAVIFLCLVACLFFSVLFVPHVSLFSFPDYAQSDIWQQSYASKWFLAQSLHAGQLPLWNPFVATGYPAFAKAESGALYLPNLIFYTFLPFVWAVNMSYVCTILLMSLSVLALARRWKFSIEASVIVALLWSYSSFFLTKFPHISRIQTASLAPLIILFMDIYVKKPKVYVGVILSMLIAQQIYAGHFQMIFMTWLLVGAYSVWLIWKQKSWRQLHYFILPWIMGVILGAVQLLPSWELISLSSRSQGFDPVGAVRFSFPWEAFKTLVSPFALGNPADGTFPHYALNGGSIFWENALYCGIIGFALSVIGIVRGKRFALYIPVLILGATGILLMTGKFSPLYFVHSMFPFSYFRAPSKYSFFVTIALALLAGMGVDSIPSKKNRWIIWIMVIVIVAELYAFHNTYTVVDNPSHVLNRPAIVDKLKLDSQHRYVTYGSGTPWDGAFLKEGWTSMVPYDYLLNALRPDVNVLYGIKSFDVYQILRTRRQALATDIMNTLFAQAAAEPDRIVSLNNYLDLQSIHSIIGLKFPKQFGDSHIIQPPHGYTQKPLYYIERADVPQRIRIVNHAFTAVTVEQVLRTLEKPEFQAHDSAILENDIADPLTARKSSVKIVVDKPTKMVIRTQTDGSSLLLIADSLYPGWKASVDGVSTQIMPANINQRAVYVPGGLHTVQLEYLPLSFQRGLLISLTGYGAIVLAGLWCLKHRAS